MRYSTIEALKFSHKRVHAFASKAIGIEMEAAYMYVAVA